MSPEKLAFYAQIATIIILIPIIITFIANLRKKYFSFMGRVDKLSQIAKKFNLSFIENPDEGFFDRTVKFGLLEIAKSKEAYNLITGEINGHKVKIFDFVYVLITGTNIASYQKRVSTPQNSTIFLIEIKNTELDYFYISKKMEQPKIIKSIVKHIIKDDIDINVKDKFPRFAEEFTVHCSDKKKVYNIIKNDLVNKLSQTQFDLKITIKGKYLLISSGTDFISLNEFDKFINDCMDITSIIEK